MKLVQFRYCTRLLMIVMVIVAFGLSACGGGTTFPAKRDAGTDSNNESDTGVNSDTGSGSDTEGADSGGNNNDDNNPCRQTTADDAAAFSTDYAVALCSKFLSCDRNSELRMMALFDAWVDQDSCVEAILAKNMSPEQARAAVNNKTMRLDSCAATSCLNQIAALDCSDADGPYTQTYSNSIPDCYEALVGKIATGKACTIDGQCGENEFCQSDDEADVCGGTCEDVGLLIGQCGDIVCRGDQYCTPENDVCVSRKANDAACEADYECAYDAQCVASVCKKITSGLDVGAVCDSMNALCKVGLMCINEKCVVPGAVGDACEYVGCGPGLYCTDNNECAERGDVGAACSDGWHCKSMECVQGACTDSDALCE